VGISSPAELLRAAGDFARELGADSVPVVVQPMLPGQVEIALGIVRDSAFGPLVMVAAGGTALDVWDDRAFLMPPFDRVDARRAIRSLRVWPLLDGYRGSPRVDVVGLERALVRLGRLAAEVPEVAELDLNPVMASASGIAIVDAKVRLAPAVALQTGIPRQLSTTL
jgi:acyl-CoA synthetase (NDP forming)